MAFDISKENNQNTNTFLPCFLKNSATLAQLLPKGSNFRETFDVSWRGGGREGDFVGIWGNFCLSKNATTTTATIGRALKIGKDMFPDFISMFHLVLFH